MHWPARIFQALNAFFSINASFKSTYHKFIWFINWWSFLFRWMQTQFVPLPAVWFSCPSSEKIVWYWYICEIEHLQRISVQKPSLKIMGHSPPPKKTRWISITKKKHLHREALGLYVSLVCGAALNEDIKQFAGRYQISWLQKLKKMQSFLCVIFRQINFCLLFL